jgi:hypothetical protein
VSLKTPIVENMPSVIEVRDKLGDALREVMLLRRLLRIAERAEQWRQRDKEVVDGREGASA